MVLPVQPGNTVLVTGFDPFGGETLNPSWLAVQPLGGRTIAGHKVVSAQLPTQFAKSLVALDALLQAHRPDWVFCIGQAGGRSAISIERIAINVDDARIPDNAHAQPVDIPVAIDGPAAYFSTLPIKAMRAALLAASIPGEVSQTAGTFVCNHVFYGLMHRLQHLKGVRGGFIHVPFLPEQGTPNLPLEVITRGIELCVETALRHEGADLAQAAGATH